MQAIPRYGKENGPSRGRAEAVQHTWGAENWAGGSARIDNALHGDLVPKIPVLHCPGLRMTWGHSELLHTGNIASRSIFALGMRELAILFAMFAVLLMVRGQQVDSVPRATAPMPAVNVP